ncbi:response regulator transcription factor [Patescibacteria group bacterium]|nr:MAG: response regulator transcription factor [Patescibacteria group bacterium]
MRILVIEDDSAMVAAIRRSLQSNYIIDVATNGHDGLHLADINQYDLVMLDLSLPDCSGLTVCSKLRANGYTTPILVVTARAEVQDKVSLLDVGADDYLTKPFSLDELKARIRALLRREGGTSYNSQIVVGDLVVDTASRSVSMRGQSVPLRRKEFDLLEYLARSAGKTLTRQMILDHVWEMNDNIWTNAIDVHIKYLRDKIDRRFGVRMIQTVHGIGYKLELPQPAIGGKRR